MQNMNIYSNPEQIKKISANLTHKTLIAWTPGKFDYHFYDDNYYSIFQPGTGNYPEMIKKDQISVDAIWIKTRSL